MTIEKLLFETPMPKDLKIKALGDLSYMRMKGTSIADDVDIVDAFNWEESAIGAKFWEHVYMLTQYSKYSEVEEVI